MVAPNKVESNLIAMNDLFASYQGEGTQIGRPVIFTRVSKCNMSCWFCDTNYEPVIGEYSPSELFDLIEDVYLHNMDIFCHSQKAVLLTGGEPSIYNLEPLLKLLKNHGYWVGMESNGVNDTGAWVRDQLIDHLTVSPKAPKGLNATVAHEVRLVTQSFVDIEYMQRLENAVLADKYYLSPMEVNDQFNFIETYKLLDQARYQCEKPWAMSLQTHKLAGIK